MPLTDVTPLEAEIEIDASPAQVWALVGDLRNMPRWSPQCRKVIVRGGQVREDATMININRRGLLVWPTQSQVVAYEPERRVAFRVKENYTVWSFELTPTAMGGTRVVQRREAPQGISDISVRLTRTMLGGVEGFTQELRDGMRQTLERVKAEAER